MFCSGSSEVTIVGSMVLVSWTESAPITNIVGTSTGTDVIVGVAVNVAVGGTLVGVVLGGSTIGRVTRGALVGVFAVVGEGGGCRGV